MNISGKVSKILYRKNSQHKHAQCAFLNLGEQRLAAKRSAAREGSSMAH